MSMRVQSQTHQNHTTMDGYRRWRSSMVEQLICNQQVAGSSPIASSVEPRAQRARANEHFGRVPERSKGTDCKSVATGFEGSNPSPSTASKMRAMELGNQQQQRVERSAALPRGAHRGRVWAPVAGSHLKDVAGVAQLVELQPSKLDVAGSRPVSRSIRVPISNAHVAQLAEHVLGKDEVTRSIRVVGSSLMYLSAA